ncbi:MAG: hypothetical protein J7K61_01555 [Thermoplasmata archaeon]|nr:hypothetical protein [Thermoplasmata archaeon]
MDVKKVVREMKKIFVLGVVAILLSTTLLPAVVGDDNKDLNEKTIISVRTSLETISEKEVPLVVALKLHSIISQLINHTDGYETLLPALLNILDEYGLIKNSEKMEIMMRSNLENNKNCQIMQPWCPFILNIMCFVVGYGINSWLFTPGLFLSALFLFKLQEIFPSIDVDRILDILILWNLRPRVFIPIAGWNVFEGAIYTVGLLGYRHYEKGLEGVNNSLTFAREFLILGFTGIWISFLFTPRQYFIGSAIAIL